MSKRMFIIIFMGIHLAFIFLQIHKHSYLIALSFTKQKNEKKKQALTEKKNMLTQDWYTVQNRTAVKKFAEKNLKMKKVSLSQIKQLP